MRGFWARPSYTCHVGARHHDILPLGGSGWDADPPTERHFRDPHNDIDSWSHFVRCQGGGIIDNYSRTIPSQAGRGAGDVPAVMNTCHMCHRVIRRGVWRMGEIFAATFFTTGTFNIDTQSDGGTTFEISFYTLKAASFNSCYIWSSTDCFIFNDSSATLFLLRY